MGSGMSSFERKGWFNTTLLRKNLTRFWPLWAVYAAALFLTLDMPILRLETTLFHVRAALVSPSAEFQANYVQDMVEEFRYIARDAMMVAVFGGVVFGCLLAMALFSYLMNRRSVGMIHALPIKREGLFLTNWVSGFIFVTGPSLLAFFIALFAELGKGVGLAGAKELLLWLLVNISVTLFFFDFALCCAMFTGHILALPVFYGILNVLVAGMYFLAREAEQVLVVGMSPNWGIPAPVRWVTPVAQLTELLESWEWSVNPDGTVAHELLSSSLQAAAYAILVGAVLLLIAFWVYRARQMERAEDLVTVRWVQPIFRYGVGVCTGFALGSLLYENFFGGEAWVYIALVVACAVVGGFIGQMFLRKTLRVLRSGWKGSLALGCCMLLLLCGIRMDMMGLQRYVPQADQVAEVALSGPWTSPSDGGSYLSIQLDRPELIERVVDLHRGIVDQLDTVEQVEAGTYPLERSQYESVYFKLYYYMKDGRVLQRGYNVPVTREDLEDPASWGYQLMEFIEDPQVMWANYLSTGADVDSLEAVGGSLWQEGGGGSDRLGYEEAQLLWKAIREDVAAGRYHRYLFRDEECSQNTMDWEVYLDLYGEVERGEGIKSTSIGVTIELQYSATATVEAMKKLGYGDAIGKTPGGAEIIAGNP